MAVDADPVDRTLSSLASVDEPDDPRDVSEPLDSAEADETTSETDVFAGNVVDGKLTWRRRLHGSPLGWGLVLVICVIAALGAVGGWLGYQLMQARDIQHNREMFLQAGRQAGHDLTTIDFTDADQGIKRVLNSATGSFADQFTKNSAGFADDVRRAHAKTTGAVAEVGIESMTGSSAQVLVAVTVTTSSAETGQQPPRHWRMRITLDKVGNEAKVSNVGFIS